MVRHLAVIAFALGFLAVGLAAVRNNFMQPAKPVSATQRLKEVAADAAAKLIEEKVLGREASVPDVPRGDWKSLPLHPYQMVYTFLGLVAIALGGVSWAKKRQVRLAGLAVALGLIAVAWEYALIGVMIAVVIFILANLG